MQKRIILLGALMFSSWFFPTVVFAQNGASPITVPSNVAEERLRTQIRLIYPPLAKQARIQGAVVLDVVIAADGSVASANVIRGHPLLVNAAMESVKQWKYQPFLINGVGIKVETQITVTFSLDSKTAESSPTQRLADTLRASGKPAELVDEKSGKKLAPQLEDCCHNGEQELAYCKAWAADREHIPVSYKKWVSGGIMTGHYKPDYASREGFCTQLLTDTHDFGKYRGRPSETGGVTEQEYQVAQQTVKEDEERLAKNREFAERRCTAADPRSVSEQVSDPVCVQKKQLLAAQRDAVQEGAQRERSLSSEKRLNNVSNNSGANGHWTRERCVDAVDTFTAIWTGWRPGILEHIDLETFSWLSSQLLKCEQDFGRNGQFALDMEAEQRILVSLFNVRALDYLKRNDLIDKFAQQAALPIHPESHEPRRFLIRYNLMSGFLKDDKTKSASLNLKNVELAIQLRQALQGLQGNRDRIVSAVNP
jgi:TonB family protein